MLFSGGGGKRRDVVKSTGCVYTVRCEKGCKRGVSLGGLD